MQMREKYSSHARRVDLQPGQAGRQTPTGIEKKHLVTGDHQRADTEAFTAERWSTHCAEKNDLQLGLAAAGRHGLGTWRAEREDHGEGHQRREAHASSK